MPYCAAMVSASRDVPRDMSAGTLKVGGFEVGSTLSSEVLRELETFAAHPDDQIDTSDPDAPEVLDWSGATRGRFYRK